MLENYQKEFIRFLLDSRALQFGEFKLKSGRLAPYFVNAAAFNDGELIAKLGKFYASHLIGSGLKEVNNIFGPAYKGIPLAVATSISLFKDFNLKCGYSFDRKEAKQYGDGGKIVGKKIDDSSRIVIVEDVVTAGTTLMEVIPALRETAKVTIEAVIISVDRQEKGSTNSSAVEEMKKLLDIKILPIVTITQIIDYLKSEEAGTDRLNAEVINKINSYRQEYGA